MESNTTSFQDNALEQGLTPNEPSIIEGDTNTDTDITAYLKGVGFESLEEAYKEYGVANLQGLHQSLEQHLQGSMKPGPLLLLWWAIRRRLGLPIILRNKAQEDFYYKMRKKKIQRWARKGKRKAIPQDNIIIKGSKRKKYTPTIDKKAPSTPVIPPTDLSLPIPKPAYQIDYDGKPIKIKKPAYNIDPIPSLGMSSIPSSSPKVNMEKQPVNWHDTTEDKRAKYNIGKIKKKKQTQNKFKINGRPIKAGQSYLLKIETPTWSPEPNNPAGAQKALKDLADYLIQSGRSVYLGGNFFDQQNIQGFTNGTSPSALWSKRYKTSTIKKKGLSKWKIKTYGDFAKERARQVRLILIKLGVPASQINFGIGLYFNNPNGRTTSITIQ